ncbi:MAG: hypothetical protein U1F34_07460 [Gammaproteobacteria bacterium]
MKNSIIVAVYLSTSLLFTGSAIAEEHGNESKEPANQMEHTMDMKGDNMSMGHNMMQGDDRPMMGGGGKCRMMGEGGMHGMQGMMDRVIHIPALPPGNEKLQLMMQAEILQKVGEVEAKYAAQINDKATP